MATPAELREQVQQFQLQLTHFGLPLSTLSTKISTFSKTSSAESAAQISAALDTTKTLLTFLHANPTAATPRIHGELLSYIGQLFGLFAVAEGVAATLASESKPMIREIEEFEEDNVVPMATVLEQLKDLAQKSSDRLAERVKELKTQQMSVRNEAESKLESKKGMEAQLGELTESVAELYRQVELMEVEKTALERKALRLKQRRRSQEAAVAGSFFNAFAPVFIPLAVSGGAVAVVTQDQILTLTERIRALRSQISTVASRTLEDSIEKLKDEHSRLDGIALAMSIALQELEADQEFTGNTCLLLTALDDQLEAMRKEAVKAKQMAGTLRQKLDAEAEKAERCKHELAQALVTTSRMEYNEAKAYVLAPVRTSLKVLEHMPEAEAARRALAELTGEHC